MPGEKPYASFHSCFSPPLLTATKAASRQKVPAAVRWHPPHRSLISPQTHFTAQVYIHQGKVDVARANLSLADIQRLPVPLAPEDEQVRITSALGTAHLAAGASEDMLEPMRRNLDALDSAILAKAFRGELVPQDPNDEPASALLERVRAERESGVATTPTKRTQAKRATKASKRASG